MTTESYNSAKSHLIVLNESFDIDIAKSVAQYCIMSLFKLLFVLSSIISTKVNGT